MKKILSILLAAIMLFSIASATIISASAAEPYAAKISATAYEIKINQTVTKEQAAAKAAEKLASASEGIETVKVIYAASEALLSKAPIWEYVTAYRNDKSEIKTVEGFAYQEYIGLIISEISLGKTEYYVYGTTSNCNPLLFKAVKVEDVNAMEVTTDITSADMAVAVANGILKEEVKAGTTLKPILAVYAVAEGKYSAVQSYDLDGSKIWSGSITTFSAQDLTQAVSEGRVYVISKNDAGNIWDMIVEFFQTIFSWFMSIFNMFA